MGSGIGYRSDQRFNNPTRFAAKAGRASAPARRVDQAWPDEATLRSHEVHRVSDARMDYKHRVSAYREPTARK
jgi:hypothetical protein